MENLYIDIENFRSYLILEKSLSLNSVEAYLIDINKFVKYSTEFHKVAEPIDFTYSILTQYITYISKQGVTKRTQARCISSIRSFFKFLVYDGKLPENPTELIETPKINKKLPNILTNEDIDSMLNAVEMYKPEGQRNKAIIELLHYTGLRVSELITVKISNINFLNNTIKIEGKDYRERIIPLDPKPMTEIKKYIKLYRNNLNILGGYKDILFLNNRGKAMSRISVFNIVQHLSNKAGLKKNISPFWFRHTFALHLVKEGYDLNKIKKIMGYKMTVTSQAYFNINIS